MTISAEEQSYYAFMIAQFDRLPLYEKVMQWGQDDPYYRPIEPWSGIRRSRFMNKQGKIK